MGVHVGGNGVNNCCYALAVFLCIIPSVDAIFLICMYVYMYVYMYM